MSANIKKQFAEVYEILSANQDKKVSSILELLLPVMESKQRDSNQRINEAGNLEIFCYYHKEWEDTTLIEYGRKANTKTGLNTMCKVGVNCWTKQQRDYKEAKASLLEQIADKKITPDQLPGLISDLETEKDRILTIEEYFALQPE